MAKIQNLATELEQAHNAGEIVSWLNAEAKKTLSAIVREMKEGRDPAYVLGQYVGALGELSAFLEVADRKLNRNIGPDAPVVA